ncbi:hypothetical protein XSR1_250029 [Xenorhabdus szentirmaii DSM 16338]|uniref:Uncharacterized protein n=1 Tax=Xenorhabdus szentirmaii DSM 16338 TaxID=1427518 RepID=W1IYD2_9GAMM|nr:hypothetical protein XSR1_250029 [Xenorhabdus szentirmaii DSM 16338]
MIRKGALDLVLSYLDNKSAFNLINFAKTNSYYFTLDYSGTLCLVKIKTV